MSKSSLPNMPVAKRFSLGLGLVSPDPVQSGLSALLFTAVGVGIPNVDCAVKYGTGVAGEKYGVAGEKYGVAGEKYGVGGVDRGEVIYLGSYIDGAIDGATNTSASSESSTGGAEGLGCKLLATGGEAFLALTNPRAFRFTFFGGVALGVSLKRFNPLCAETAIGLARRGLGVSPDIRTKGASGRSSVSASSILLISSKATFSAALERLTSSLRKRLASRSLDRWSCSS